MSTLTVSEARFIKITYGAVFTLSSVVVSLSIWAATLQSNASITAEKVKDLENAKNKQEDVNHDLLETLHSIDKRTVRIETLIKAKE